MTSKARTVRLYADLHGSRSLCASLHFNLELSKCTLATLVFIRIVREPQLLRLYVTSEGTPQDPYSYVDLIRLEEQQVDVVGLHRTGSLH